METLPVLFFSIFNLLTDFDKILWRKQNLLVELEFDV